MNLLSYFCLSIFLTNLSISLSQSDGNLTSYLMYEYDKSILPDNRIDLNITLFLRQIVSLDEKNQIMISNIYVAVEWVDGRLNWSSSSFSGIDKVIIPAKKLWIPDLTVVNAADGDGFLKVTDSNMGIVFNDSSIYLILSVNSLKTRCKMNVRKFPFDTQNCTIELASWILSTDDITIANYGIVYDEYIPNPVWNLSNISYYDYRSSKRFIGSISETYETEDIVFSLKLERRPLYAMINGIFPCLVLNLITIFAFIIPFANQVALTMTVILTFSVNALRVSSDIPVQSEYLPLITVYFILSSFYSLLSLIWFIIANLFLTKNYIPKWLSIMASSIYKLFRPKKNSIVAKKDDGSNVEENLVVKAENENINKKINQNELKEINSEQNKIIIVQEKPKENAANLSIQNKKDEADNKKKHIEKCVKVLNYLMMIFMTFFITTSNLCIWLIISN